MRYIKVLKLRKKTPRLYEMGVHRSYAKADGWPVLRHEAHGWKNVNGIWIGLPRRRVWILFRRPVIKS